MLFLKRPLFWLLLLPTASILAWLFAHPASTQWDFQTYYFAVKAFFHGNLSPYNLQDISWVGGKSLYPFVYPPAILPFFWPFLAFSPTTASWIFLALKLLALFFLIRLWLRHFLPNEDPLWFLAFALFAFQSPLYRDLTAGNISIFEQLGIWSALAFLLRGRYAVFTALITFVAFFKLVPLVFLGLLPFTRYRYRWQALGLGFLSFGAFFAASQVIAPDLSRQFFQTLGTLHKETPLFDPSTPTLIRAFLEHLSVQLTLPLPASFPRLLAFFACFTFFLLSLLLFLRLRETAPSLPTTEAPASLADHQAHLRLLIFVFCASLPLFLPRFKDYTYILLLVPTFALLRRLGPQAGAIGFALLFCLSMDTGLAQGMPPLLALPGFRFFYAALQMAFPWFLALLAWFYWRLEIQRAFPDSSP